MKIPALGVGIALVASCWVCDSASAQSSNPPGTAAELAKRPTPKMPDGHPDLNGTWLSSTGGGLSGFALNRLPDGSIESNLSKESAKAIADSFKPSTDSPPYKPEYQAKLKQMQAGSLNRQDKVFTCGQPGLPRVGAPEQIIQQAKQVVFLNADLSGMVFRVVPIGGTYRDTDPSYYGVGVARWEGDTLVVDTRNLSTDTWVGEWGYFHSEKLRVIERFRRVGDTIEYNVAVEDPEMLTQPWVKPLRILSKTDRPLDEPYPCDSSNVLGIDEPRHDQRAR